MEAFCNDRVELNGGGYESSAIAIGCNSVPRRISRARGDRRRFRQSRRPSQRLSNAMGAICRTPSGRPYRWPVRIRVYGAHRLHSPPAYLRSAGWLPRIPLGHRRVRHAGAVERLSIRHPPVDQPAWRAERSDAMAAGSQHLPLFPQVLSRLAAPVATANRTAKPRRKAMRFTRRFVTFAATLALAAPSLLQVSRLSAQSNEEAAVLQAVEALTKAMLDADRARLEELVADQLSYGHSSGVIQTK